jgi:hypothetical protein
VLPSGAALLEVLAFKTSARFLRTVRVALSLAVRYAAAALTSAGSPVDAHSGFERNRRLARLGEWRVGATE